MVFSFTRISLLLTFRPIWNWSLTWLSKICCVRVLSAAQNGLVGRPVQNFVGFFKIDAFTMFLNFRICFLISFFWTSSSDRFIALTPSLEKLITCPDFDCLVVDIFKCIFLYFKNKNPTIFPTFRIGCLLEKRVGRAMRTQHIFGSRLSHATGTFPGMSLEIFLIRFINFMYDPTLITEILFIIDTTQIWG